MYKAIIIHIYIMTNLINYSSLAIEVANWNINSAWFAYNNADLAELKKSLYEEYNIDNDQYYIRTFINKIWDWAYWKLTTNWFIKSLV